MEQLLVEYLGLRYQWPGSPGLDRERCAVMYSPYGDSRMVSPRRDPGALASFFAPGAGADDDVVWVLAVDEQPGMLADAGIVPLPEIVGAWRASRAGLAWWLDYPAETDEQPTGDSTDWDSIEDIDEPRAWLYVDQRRKRLLLVSDDDAWVVAPRAELEELDLDKRLDLPLAAIERFLQPEAPTAEQFLAAVTAATSLKDGEILADETPFAFIVRNLAWIYNALNDQEFEEFVRLGVKKVQELAC